MSEKADDMHRTPAREPGSARTAQVSDPAMLGERQIRDFVEDHPLLCLAFVAAVGYVLGRSLSKL